MATVQGEDKVWRTEVVVVVGKFLVGVGFLAATAPEIVRGGTAMGEGFRLLLLLLLLLDERIAVVDTFGEGFRVCCCWIVAAVAFGFAAMFPRDTNIFFPPKCVRL